MSEKICLFAGTTEGRRLAEALGGRAELTVCVATEYGEALLDSIEGITVRQGRMDKAEMARFFAEGRFSLVLDATHPYATLVTENIAAAAAEAGVPVMRILRGTDRAADDAVYVPTIADARDYLTSRPGRILLTTGSKELAAYAGLDMSRVWARVLPTAEALAACAAAGIPAAHVIAAQGPFSEALNEAQLKSIGASYLVTKSSGRAGGFEEKIRACRAAGVQPVVIGTPPQTAGVSLEEALRRLGAAQPETRRAVTVIGVGPGGEGALTLEARGALRQCELLLGAQSVLDTLTTEKETVAEFLPARVRDALDARPDVRHAAVAMRGDVGFYSGAKKLLDALSGYAVTLLPGVSSVAAFAARLGTSWDDAALLSLHGRPGNLLHAVTQNRKSFVLCGGENSADAVCRTLCEFGLGDLPTAVGERLGYSEERVTRTTAAEAAARTWDALCLLYIENEAAVRRVRHGIPDEEFLRDEVPMTKAEVRAVSLSKLDLPADAVVYDVGAGTGSVSVECALAAYEGQVFAIEKEADAAALIRRNRRKFYAENLCVVEGEAPDALCGLPAPTHAFIGGASGNLTAIVGALVARNPSVRIVINAVTVETQAEAAACAASFGFAEAETVTVNVARARRLGRYHLMNAQNPVTIVTLAGGVDHA